MTKTEYEREHWRRIGLLIAVGGSLIVWAIFIWWMV